MVAQAMGGIMSITGHPDGPPARVGSSIGDLAAALFCAVGIVSALFERRSSGVGRHVDVSMLDSQVALLENAIARYQATGVVPGPLGARHPSITPFGVYRAGGGTALVIAAGNDELFARLCRAVGLPSLLGDPLFASNDLRCRHSVALESVLEAALAARPAEEWLVVLGGAGVPCAPINDVAAVLADPQVGARHMVVRLAGGAVPGLKVAGNPIKLSGVADPVVRPGAPALDGDRRAILSQLANDDHAHHDGLAREPVRHRFSVKDYHRMAEAELFTPDQRLELLGGAVFETAPIGSRHAATVARLNRLFVPAVGDRAIVQVQNPITLDDLSEPQPDLVLLHWRDDFYVTGHPGPADALLVIEVSETTANWDRTVTRPLYSAAGIAEMWIVDLALNLIEVGTDPGPEDYRAIRPVLPGARLAPQAFPDLSLSVADLLA
jgi:Uma2 family endonuclease